MEWYFYLLIVLSFLILVGIIVLFILLHKYAKDIFRHKVWKKLYKLAQNYDYFLLNDVNLRIESNKNIHIDHLLIGDKFVYVIATRLYEDNIEANKLYDPKWNIVASNGTFIKAVTNPVIVNEKRTVMLQSFLGCSKKGEMFKSIVVVNDNIDLKVGTSTTSKGSYLLKKKEVYKTIKRIEKESELNPFDEEQLQKVVNRIHIMSEEQNKAASLFKK